MSNIYLKVTIETFSKLRLLKLGKLKNEMPGSKTVYGFSITLILKGVMMF